MTIGANQVVEAISDATDITKSDVRAILKAQVEVAAAFLASAEEGERVNIIPGAIALYKNFRPATKQRKGINPFTGEPIVLKAKPAHWRVRATVRKKIKDAV